MQVTQLVQEIIKNRRITPDVERRLDTMLWSRDFNESELAALKQLEKLLSDGTVIVG